MRMGKKMRILTILMSIAVIATTLGFATFALTQNNVDVDFGGDFKITGDADIDVTLQFIDCATGQVQFEIIADENGIIEKQGGNVVNSVTDVKDLNSYSIVSQPVLNLGKSYKFVITISNPNSSNNGTAYATAKVDNVSLEVSEDFGQFYSVVNPSIGEGILKPGTSLSYEIQLNNNATAVLDNGDAVFGYNINIVANKVVS